ncbi:MAG: NAD(P)H-hydrate epimerase, partial [Oscillospiraceae bacterium]
MRVLFGSEMKALEASADRRGVGYQVMMEQAGNAAADWIAGQLAPVRCTVLCGTGNNGGDGYFAAKRLREAGVSVTLAPILGGPKTELAQHAREQAEQAGVPIVGPADAPDCCRSADVVLDALFGIGFHGEIPESARRLARELEQHPCVVALDLPSGLGADSPAEPPVSIAARHTLCLGAAKPACLMLPARQRCGAVHILST